VPSHSWRPSQKGGIKRERMRMREHERGAASGFKASVTVTKLRGLEVTDGLKFLGAVPETHLLRLEVAHKRNMRSKFRSFIRSFTETCNSYCTSCPLCPPNCPPPCTLHLDNRPGLRLPI